MTDDFSRTHGGGRECPKCGAPLPADDEVLCQNCGTAFGVKTTVIKAVAIPDDLDSPPQKKKPKPTWEPTSRPPAGTGSPLVILVIVGLVAAIAGLVLILLLLSS